MRVLAAAALSLVLAALMSTRRVDASPSCADLAKLALPCVTSTVASTVEAGAFAPPTSARADAFRAIPAFCRVAATLTPTEDSDIKMEVWLQASRWNGKLMAVGNGAFSGAIGYSAMAATLARGYAVSSTDTGHRGGSASFALGHPEKLIDFAWRSEHEMTVAAKVIVNAFYGRAPKFSYWNGCSAGGRQALTEAQMFPADYDGIVAGSPGLDWSARSAQAVRVAHALKDPEARLTPEALDVLHGAVLAACDAQDGLKDGLVSDPSRCHFDRATVRCQSAGAARCLTAAQVAGARAVYAASANAVTKREMPGLAPGSER